MDGVGMVKEGGNVESDGVREMCGCDEMAALQ